VNIFLDKVLNLAWRKHWQQPFLNIATFEYSPKILLNNIVLFLKFQIKNNKIEKKAQ